ncbi:MAG: enoyl-CoA hydratase-related protein [Actinomycetota bacterium]
MTGASDLVRFDVDDEIATITLDSQHNRNALSRQLVAELDAAIDAAESAHARAIVLTHEGPAFCAGADLKERASDDPADRDGSPFVRVMTRLMDTERPTIAAVNGAVRAGGIGLMASCDLVVVHESVSFALTEVRIGVAAAMISVPILRRVQASRLTAALLTGEAFDADEARSVGLVTHVSADVGGTVDELCHGIRCGAMHAVAETKAILRLVPTLDRDVAFERMTELSNKLFAGPDAIEGMAAFREKRRPSWHPDGPA